MTGINWRSQDNLKKLLGGGCQSHVKWSLPLNTVLASLCLNEVVLDLKKVRWKTLITELSRRSTDTLRSLSYESLKVMWV